MSTFEETARIFMLERFGDTENILSEIEDELVIESEITRRIDELTPKQKEKLIKILEDL